MEAGRPYQGTRSFGPSWIVPQATWTTPPGEAFPHGVGGARSEGPGRVRIDQQVIAAARSRVGAALEAGHAGVAPFMANGMLPAGVHDSTWGEFLTRFATNGRRVALAGQLRPVLDEFARNGVTRVAIGGSYVTDKAHPGDIDLAWLSSDDARRPAFSIQARVRDRTLMQSPEVHLYRADELFTDIHLVRPGETYLEFFQHDRLGRERGVVSLPTVPTGAGASLRARLSSAAMAIGLLR